ncbi:MULTISPECIES: ATP-grasp domain-containing protein [unclassified Fusibacter]|uniref:ATP-binding protein n=1 Tax=unclassified Fusibacter TaxID=2624464 RepID=UPI0010134C5F|nr:MULTISPECIES: ATP-grasp domain-containing protein [unclassified Fusibacter]MCK8058184.1 ATP-grasp domain-containing protein [Fusibacter sp. A2]NPE20767.1 ATP-grasp domain-containing protein [Fusibacter sp. A1]RXV62974.1 ATP-grasp domain-containing protein [Fusibacter sp. A1]
MNVMILGGGANQLSAIKMLKELGHRVIVSDYTNDSPGKEVADHSVFADTFSYEESLEAALESGAEAVLVTATDQPVLTAAKMCEKLSFPFQVSGETAHQVTNKKAMKHRLNHAKIPTLKCIYLDEDTTLAVFQSFHYPAVLKPADSQGQRGIFKVDSAEEAFLKFKESLTYSRTGEVLLEEYYENQEVTVSGWVAYSEATVLTITDRVTFDDTDKLGICISHEHPTVHLQKWGRELESLSKAIVEAFEIQQGPFYFQFLIGSRGIVVNEIACRIGGAHEDQFIKELTGFDILKAQIDLITGEHMDTELLADYDFYENTSQLTVQLFFASPGKVQRITPRKDILQLEGVLDFKCHYKVGDQIPDIRNASARAGYLILKAPTEQKLIERIEAFNRQFEIRGIDNENLYRHGKRGNRK